MCEGWGYLPHPAALEDRAASGTADAELVGVQQPHCAALRDRAAQGADPPFSKCILRAGLVQSIVFECF